jgi:hypothetical protein
MSDNDVIAKLTEKASRDVELQRLLARAFASGDSQQLNKLIMDTCGQMLSDAKVNEIVGGRGMSVGGQMYVS